MKQAQRLATRLGQTLYRSFVGRPGTEVLRRVEPTAVMLQVDETMLSLPWELMPGPEGSWRDDVPLGRIVATGIVPARGRDPKDEDPLVRLLVIANPTGDLDAAEVESDAIVGLAGTHGDVKVEVTRLSAAQATPSGLRAAVKGQDFDVIHVAGHGAFSAAAPGESALDPQGWPAAGRRCRTPRVGRTAVHRVQQRLRVGQGGEGSPARVAAGRTNGLAAAFLAAGAEAYIGHFWPVDDWDAATFATTFYKALFERVNVGGAVLEARQAVMGSLTERGLLTGTGAVFFGDAGTAERRDIASAA